MERLTNSAKVTQPESSRARIQMQAVWLQGPCSTKSVDSVASASWPFFLGWGCEPWKPSPFRQLSRENRKLFWPRCLHEYLSNWAWWMAPMGSFSSVGFSREGMRPCKLHSAHDCWWKSLDLWPHGLYFWLSNFLRLAAEVSVKAVFIRLTPGNQLLQIAWELWGYLGLLSKLN